MREIVGSNGLPVRRNGRGAFFAVGATSPIPPLTDENSPALQGWEGESRMTRPVPEGRQKRHAIPTILSSLRDFTSGAETNPVLKDWAIFKRRSERSWPIHAPARDGRPDLLSRRERNEVREKSWNARGLRTLPDFARLHPHPGPLPLGEGERQPAFGN